MTWLAHEDPTVRFCGRLGRAAARPYRIGPGRDDLPVARVSPSGQNVSAGFPGSDPLDQSRLDQGPQ